MPRLRSTARSLVDALVDSRRTPASRPRSRPLVLAALVASTVAVACGSDPASSTNPGSLQRVSGDSQTVVVGAALAAPMVVRVLADNGEPLSGIAVSWALASSATGTLASSSSTTDATGQTSMDFTAGSIAGKAEITVSSGALTGIVFSHTVIAGAASALAKVSGDGVAALVGSGVQVVVRVTDSFGNAVPDVAVNWAFTGAGAVLSDTSSTSDSAGRARVTLTLGTTPGVYTVTATSGTFTPVTFSITAI